MTTVRTVVHGDHQHGWIIELHDGDHFRTYSPQNCEHPMDAAQAAAAAFAEQFPAHDSPTVDWEYPVDKDGKRIPLRYDMTADEPNEVVGATLPRATIEADLAADPARLVAVGDGVVDPVSIVAAADLRPGAAATNSTAGEDPNDPNTHSSNKKAPPGDGAAGSASPGPGDGAPEVSTDPSTDD